MQTKTRKHKTITNRMKKLAKSQNIFMDFRESARQKANTEASWRGSDLLADAEGEPLDAIDENGVGLEYPDPIRQWRSGSGSDSCRWLIMPEILRRDCTVR